MAVRPLLIALTTIALALALLSAMVLTLSPLTGTELGLGLTAGVWSVVAGLSLHVVAKRFDRGAIDPAGAGERVPARR